MDILNRLKVVFSIDLRTLALFRMCLGAVVLFDLALRSLDIIDFYTDDGVLTRTNWLKVTNKFHWSLHAASGELWFQIVLFLLAAIFAFCLMIGYRTKIMSALVWVMTISLINRNGFVLQGGDELLAVLTFWAMFLPLQARYSVDAALAIERQSDANASPVTTTDGTSAFFSIATVAVILQVLYLYIFTAILKTGAPWRESMDAAFYATSLQHFATPIGAIFRDIPWMMTFGTWFVIVLEFVGPVLALSPWFHLPLRLVSLACLYGLHASFLLMLHIGLFPLIDFTALALLIPGAVWTWLAAFKTRQHRSNIKIYFDQECGFCRKISLILREFLLPGNAQILPAQGTPDIYQVMLKQDSWVISDTSGNLLTRWKAMQYLFVQSPIFKPIGWTMKLSPLMTLGDKVYRSIAQRRQILSVHSARFFPYTTMQIKPLLVTQILAAFFLYIVTYINLVGINDLNIRKPQHVNYMQRMTRLDQKWNMFAPFPLTYSLYPVIVGNLRDGSVVDLLQFNMESPDWKAPEYIYPVFEGYRWRKFLGRVNSNSSDTIRQGYGSYLCRTWNHADRPREKQLATADLNFVRLDTNTTGEPKKRTQRRAWQHWCYDEFRPKK